MKYAVFASGGKQYKVTEGQTVDLEKLAVQAGESVNFDNVLLYVSDGAVKIGQPQLDDVTVTAKVVDQVKGDKIRVAKFKAKARYRKVIGHRQHLTRVQIETIAAKGEKKQKSEPVEEVKIAKKKSKEEKA